MSSFACFTNASVTHERAPQHARSVLLVVEPYEGPVTDEGDFCNITLHYMFVWSWYCFADAAVDPVVNLHHFFSSVSASERLGGFESLLEDCGRRVTVAWSRRQRGGWGQGGRRGGWS